MRTSSPAVVIPSVPPAVPTTSEASLINEKSPSTLAAREPTLFASLSSNIPVPSSSRLSATMVDPESSLTPLAEMETVADPTSMSSPAVLPIVKAAPLTVSATSPLLVEIPTVSVKAGALLFASIPATVPITRASSFVKVVSPESKRFSEAKVATELDSSRVMSPDVVLS